MKETAADLISTVDEFYQNHRGTEDIRASRRPVPSEWSLKEIIGHLVNSASNNHQRFMGLQFVREMQFPEYLKFHLEWLNAEKFNSMGFQDLFLLWRQFNVFISHVISNLDPGSLGNVAEVHDGKKRTLEWLATDYVRHLKDHLAQFEDTLNKTGSPG